MELTDKQTRFCQEYLIDCNATQAAIRAGYCSNSAKVIGCQNLTKLNIKQEIDKRKAELSIKTGWDIERSQAKLLHAYDVAEEHHQPAAMVSAISTLNRSHGIEHLVGGSEKTVIIISPKAPKQVENRVIESEVEDGDSV